jgi:hypothetical protein
MKSAGWHSSLRNWFCSPIFIVLIFSNASELSNGQCPCEYGIDPDSNQQSSTSSTLLYIFPPYSITISSTNCLWRSTIFLPESSSSSAINPTHIISEKSLVVQIGRGVPQNLFLDIDQSLDCAS